MTAAIVVGAGRGSRMGGPIPKQYRDLDGMAVIRHTLLAFLRHPAITLVQAVIHPADRSLYAQATEGLGLPEPVIGGSTRQESVRFGLEALTADAPAKVIIHDAVRPFVEQETISAVIEALDRVPAVITGLSVPDTLKRCADGLVEATVDRTGVWRAQTPQGFHFDKLLRAHQEVHFRNPTHADLTDDSLVIETTGLRVAMIEGSEDNFKITTERDLARAEAIIRRGRLESHVGWGFDFERFAPGDQLLICGIPVAHRFAIARGHNADVALNAVTDALLGTVGGLGESEAGARFVASRPSLRAATSDFFLRQAVSLVATRGGRIIHVGLTILAPQPAIEPHEDAMRHRLADLLAIEPNRVAIRQAESFESGIHGRGDGFAAQCLVTAQYPAL